MDKIPYKVRLTISIVLFFLSIGFIVSTIVYSNQSLVLWVVIVGPILSVISFVLFVVFMPKTNENETHVEVEKKPKRIKKYRKKKSKKPFISDKEWKDLDEEDDETRYIEEYLEDDD